MKILIGVCLSKKNFRYLNLFINDINRIIVPKNFSLKIFFILNKKDYYFKYLIKKKFVKKKCDFKILLEDNNNIPAARNRFLRELKDINFSYAGFLDDDCSISRKWLVNMVKFIKKYDCDVVGGPQRHLSINKKIKMFYDLIEPQYKSGTDINWVATNNCFFKKSILTANIKFHNAFNKFGGSDQHFFQQLKKKNFKIKWNNDSIVFERSQKTRENLKWFLQRNIRYGYSGSLIDLKLYGKLKGNFINMVKIFYLLFLSILNLIFFINYKKFYKSIFLFMRAYGRVIYLSKYKLTKYY